MKDSVTIDTLKVVNLIFSEHEYFLNENKLLKNKIELLEELNSNLEQTDSIKSLEINTLKVDAIEKEKQCKRNIKILSIEGIVLFILGLLL